ncbi:hypothetical protein BN2475_80073 [Paraburkholderia ribeironis]|uniref:Uncharacterized protein n=1 Tax=Paraburkholderia ribeironis TaxID=1247936 RepID=A0A1N7RML2_9BURK|nr:hypothetical protein BN2475_80073 [Paraburkholderia ribeironis]
MQGVFAPDGVDVDDFIGNDMSVVLIFLTQPLSVGVVDVDNRPGIASPYEGATERTYFHTDTALNIQTV